MFGIGIAAFDGNMFQSATCTLAGILLTCVEYFYYRKEAKRMELLDEEFIKRMDELKRIHEKPIPESSSKTAN